MLAFHPSSNRRALSPRPFRRFANSPIRPHDPQFPVHKIKTRNHCSNHHLANSEPPILLQTLHARIHTLCHLHTPTRPYPHTSRPHISIRAIPLPPSPSPLHLPPHPLQRPLRPPILR